MPLNALPLTTSVAKLASVQRVAGSVPLNCEPPMSSVVSCCSCPMVSGSVPVRLEFPRYSALSLSRARTAQALSAQRRYI